MLKEDEVVIQGVIQNYIDKKDIKIHEQQKVLFNSRRELERLTKKMNGKILTYESMAVELAELEKDLEEKDKKSTIKRTITSMGRSSISFKKTP